VHKLQTLFISILIIWTMMVGCEKSPLVPSESFPVVATISAVTMDRAGSPVSVPVKFNIVRNASPDRTAEKFGESLVLQSDEDGNVEFRHEFVFQGDEQSAIIADVSSPEYESLQYWTAYFSIDDTPAKQVEITFVVVPQ
jgi:hypothetical protein